MWYFSADLLANLSFGKDSESKYYFNSYESGKARKALPEEIVRQLLLVKMALHYNIPKESIVTEFPIQIGRSKKRADVVVFTSEQKPYIIAEVKAFSDADTIYQLQSYVNVTHAPYGIIATQSEFLTFQSVNGQLKRIEDLPTLIGNNESNSPQGQDFDTLGFEKLVRTNEVNSMIFIQGKVFSVKNSDLISYQKIRRLAISKGIVLPVNVSEVYWSQILQKLFSNASNSKHTLAGDESSQPRNILLTFLYECEKNASGPFKDHIFSTQELVQHVHISAPESVGRTVKGRELQLLLKQMGYFSYDFHIVENGLRKHKSLWFKGSKDEFAQIRREQEKAREK